MYEPRQGILLAMGEGACYFLCLLHLAESLHSGRYIDSVQAYSQAVKDKQLQPDCLVLDPAGIMQSFYGGRWYYHKEGPTYQCGPAEFEILRYEHPTPKEIYSHFVLGDCKGGVKYDPLGESHTVAEGYLVSKRILRLVIGEA